MNFFLKRILSFFFLFLFFFNLRFFAQTKTFDVIIAKDGTGDYTTITTAISRYSSNRKVFFVKNGTYREKIFIDDFKSNIRLIGESVDGVIVTYDDYAGKSGTSSSTADSYTVRVEGNGFYAENITFQNTSTQAQAVAIYTMADTIAFKNCKFKGYQDTHYADNGRQYFFNCEVKGDVDFIFGSAAAFFDNCKIISGNRKGGYLTAPSQSVITSSKDGGGTNLHGILIKNSEIVAENGLPDNSCYLGRPWGLNSSSVFFNCKMGSHIKPEGWSVWSTDPANESYNNHQSAFFAEYKSKFSSGALMDVSSRVDWSKQITENDTSLYTIEKYFKGWDPKNIITSPAKPLWVYIKDDSLQWEAIEGARGYIVLNNDSFIGSSINNNYFLENGTSGNYKIKTVSKYGALSEASAPAVPSAVQMNKTEQFIIRVSQNIMYLPENQYTQIFDITGKVIISALYQNQINIDILPNGIYIVKILMDKSGRTITQKFVNNNL